MFSRFRPYQIEAQPFALKYPSHDMIKAHKHWASGAAGTGSGTAVASWLAIPGQQPSAQAASGPLWTRQEIEADETLRRNARRSLSRLMRS